MNKDLEQLLVLLIPVLSIFTLTINSKSLFYQFLVLIIPQYFSILLPNTIPIINLILILIFGFNSVKSKINIKINETANKNETVNKNETANKKLHFDLARFLTISQTTICIFLCDFNFWDHRFSKNDDFSIGLMDIGIGCFMFNSGIISSKISKKRLFKNSVMLFLLGILRLAVLIICKLEVNVKEYGVHWNFYFTLSVVNFLFLLVDSKFNIILGSVLLLGYEILSNKISEIIFNDNNRILKDGVLLSIFMKNKEGILSLIPFLGFFLILNFVSKFILEKPEKLKNLWIINALVYLITRIYSRPSRRLCNLGYLSWILVVQFTFIWLFKVLSTRYQHMMGNIELIRLSSKKILQIFLFSNLLVLIFKILFDLSKMRFILGNILNFVYLLLNFVVLLSIKSQ